MSEPDQSDARGALCTEDDADHVRVGLVDGAPLNRRALPDDVLERRRRIAAADLPGAE